MFFFQLLRFGLRRSHDPQEAGVFDSFDKKVLNSKGKTVD